MVLPRRAPAFVLLVLWASGCGGVDPERASSEPPLDGYVVLDQSAEDAGFGLRVGGSCLPRSGLTPVAVPELEWALVERVSDEGREVTWLRPRPGALLSLSGAELTEEVIELDGPIEEHDDDAPEDAEP